MKTKLDIIKIVQYLKEREKPEGGFSFAPDLYPDIEDTYYAIRTLQMLNGEINRDKTINYLKTIDWKGVSFPRAIYMLVYLYVSLNVDFPPKLIELLKGDWAKSHTLDAQYFSDEIRKLIGHPLNPLNSPSHFQFQPNDNLQTLQKKVSILLNRNLNFDKPQIIRWVQFCQNGDGGFGFYPGTTSYMENTYCALEILSNLGSAPLEINTCKKYILGCQTKSGGFGRAPISFPFIESTFHAVKGLFLLGKMGGEKA